MSLSASPLEEKKGNDILNEIRSDDNVVHDDGMSSTNVNNELITMKHEENDMRTEENNKENCVKTRPRNHKKHISDHHTQSKVHQRQLVKELAMKLHTLEEVVQLELPALQEQLLQKEIESTEAYNNLKDSYEERIAELEEQVAKEKATNRSLARSIIKTNLRNKHISQEYEAIQKNQIVKEREIKVLKESIVDLRTVMTRLPSAVNGNHNNDEKILKESSPDDSMNNRTEFRLLKRKVDSTESSMVKDKLHINCPKLKESGTTGVSREDTCFSFSQELLVESENEVEHFKKLLTEKIKEISFLKRNKTCLRCSQDITACTSRTKIVDLNSSQESDCTLEESVDGSESNTMDLCKQITKRDEQIKQYRKKLNESYEEREREKRESTVAIQVI